MFKLPRNLLIIFVFILCFASVGSSQTKTEVPIVQQIGSKDFRCYPLENRIVYKELFEKIKEKEECSYLDLLKIDFSKHTLISYRVGGDCFMTVTTDVFRDDEAKTYTVQINNYWGRCRAGGRFEGWLVIEKIPTDYKIDFKENLLDDIRENKKVIESSEADLKGCIRMYNQKEFVLRTKADYLTKIRNDAQKQSCVENAEKLEFDKYSYLGLDINSGYCRRPLGLKHEVTEDISKKIYTLKVSYIDPNGQVCRALSQYELWIRLPKILEDFDLNFKVEPEISNSEK